jgi:aminoglycoside phosphotransferase (APT) family kinase protein
MARIGERGVHLALPKGNNRWEDRPPPTIVADAMELPPLRLLETVSLRVTVLVDYEYRAAWKVEVGGKQFCVKADSRPGFAAAEVSAQHHAAAAGVPVSEIVECCEEPVPALAMEWAPGRALHGLRDADAWREAGRVLRLLHEAVPLWVRDKPWVDFVSDWFAADLSYLVDQRGLERSVAEAAASRVKEVQPLMRAAPTTWLHGDCQAAHFLVDPKSTRISAVLDWGDAQPGDPVMDFAVMTLFDDGPVLDPVLDGYGATDDLRERTHALLPLYQAVRGAGAARWLDTHGYPGHHAPLDAVRRVVETPLG